MKEELSHSNDQVDGQKWIYKYLPNFRRISLHKIEVIHMLETEADNYLKPDVLQFT